MRIAVGADWIGFDLKQGLIEHIRSLGHEVLDQGTDSGEMNDYPDFAEKVGDVVAKGQADLGVVICGTGIGMSIAANKVKGIRAALCHDAFTAARARGHNDANVLALGAWVVSLPHAKELIEVFIGSPYEAGRHDPRLAKIRRLEDGRGGA
jgi:ribose 5-phosphate isomerase B